jgi:glycosyltransferase involved in cell wall biosynthesis
MSVIGQAGDVDLEILVGDDLSTDGTQVIMESLAEEFPQLVRYRRNSMRLGPAGNYLSLIERSRGSLIAHLDGDDLWAPGKLKAQVDFMEKNRDCPAVYTNALTMRDDGSSLGVFNGPQREYFDINSLMIRGNFLCHSSLLYRATLKAKILELPLPFIDYRIHLLLASHGRLGYINEALVKYRVHSSSSMLVHANDEVRKLYWEALLVVPRNMVSDKAFAGGISEFGRSVFFSSMKKRDLSLLRKWFPEIINEAPTGRTRMLMLLIAAIVRVGFAELIQVTRSALSGNYSKILYRR